MERIKRALELARDQRDRVLEQDTSQPIADEVTESRGSQAPERALQAWRTPVVAVDPSRLAAERVISAGLSGSAAAAYKLLRTQVVRRLDQLGASSLAVVSPRSSDGKTLTAINLAIALASDPNRTALLVEMDLRRPALARRFGFVPTVGIEDCLQGLEPVEHAMVRPQGYDRLTLLPARESVDLSSELLGTSRTGELVAELRNRYANRCVIFDLPPVLEADDVLAFSRHVQAVLLVVNEGRTRREDVARTMTLLSDTPIIGTVLNGARGQSETYY